jgi:hypothetical protein
MNPLELPTPTSDRADRVNRSALTTEPTEDAALTSSDGSSAHFAEDDDGGMSVIVKTVATVGIVGAVAVGYFAGRGAGASAAYGATLGLANLVFLGRMVRAFSTPGTRAIRWAIAALTKLAVILLAMYLPVRAGLVQVLPFMIGFGALPLGIVLGQLLIAPPKNKEN